MGKLYSSKIITSVKGNRLGLSVLSSGDSGSSKKLEFLVGPDALRLQHSTAETTSTNLAPTGVSVLTTAASSGVYTIDPPIPGIDKGIIFNTTGANPIYLKTANGEFIQSSQGTTMSVLVSSQTVFAAVTLRPVSTGAWAVLGQLSSAFLRTSTST